MSVVRYIHFLIALVIALPVAYFSFLFASVLTVGLAMAGLSGLGFVDPFLGGSVGMTLAASFAFWMIGRLYPLEASFGKVVLVAALAATAWYLLVTYRDEQAWRAQLAWYRVMPGAFLILATLGYLPFRSPPDDVPSGAPPA